MVLPLVHAGDDRTRDPIPRKSRGIVEHVLVVG